MSKEVFAEIESLIEGKPSEPNAEPRDGKPQVPEVFEELPNVPS